MKPLLYAELLATALLLSTYTWANEPLKPVKVTAAQAAGSIFNSKDAVKRNGPEEGETTDVMLLTSTDKKFAAGLYKAGSSDTPIEAYPVDEVCYFLSGSVKLTSADGSVLELKAGEAAMIPKGWKGRWTSPGYSKYYVIYDSK